jgi:integrase
MKHVDHHIHRIKGALYFRIRLPAPTGAIDHKVSLGNVDLPTARRIRDALIQTIDNARSCAALGLEPPAAHPAAAAYGIEPLLERLGYLRRRRRALTIADLIAAYEADAPGRQLNARSAYQAVASLRTILRAVHPGTDPETHPVTLLTPHLLEDYKATKIRAAAALGPAKQSSAQVTIASTARQAQAILARDSLAQSHMRALGLPDLEPFREWKSGFSTRRLRQELDDTTVARLAATMDGLWFTDPAAWLAMSLAGNIGLRRGEATMARWSWVRMIAGVPTIYLCRTDEASPKGNERRVAIDPPVWADICAHRTTTDYILPGATREDRDAIFDRTLLILRAHGITAGKPNHELRALQLQRAERLGGMDNAQRVAGHSDRTTTEIYTGRGTGQSIRVL